jgi:His/Glu/Gln/Arg/opine family amino acid ABC transporter permease subunit
MNYDWNFGRLRPYTDAFLHGTLVTIGLTLLVIAFGTLLGFVIGVLSRYRALRAPIWLVTNFVMALPPLVLLLFAYYLLTEQIIGTTVQAFWVCVIALSANLAAFTGDLVRAALGSVPNDALDAGRALGMTEGQLVRLIVFPHVVREIIPAMTMLYISMLKLTSLASIINVREVVYGAETVIARVSRSLEAWVIVGLIYIVLVSPLTLLARRLERLTGRRHYEVR